MAGRWLGGGATTLGRVDDPALIAVLAGRTPDGVQQLVGPPRAGQRMPGIDACFKAPKSVGLLWPFDDRIPAGSGTLDGAIEAAHDDGGALTTWSRRRRGAAAATTARYRWRRAASWRRRSASGRRGQTIRTSTRTS